MRWRARCGRTDRVVGWPREGQTMSAIPAHLLDAALQLPEDARIELANRLFESLDPAEDEGDVEAAWAEEIKRRIDDLESGGEKAIPWEEARRMSVEEDNESAAGSLPPARQPPR